MPYAKYGNCDLGSCSRAPHSLRRKEGYKVRYRDSRTFWDMREADREGLLFYWPRQLDLPWRYSSSAEKERPAWSHNHSECQDFCQSPEAPARPQLAPCNRIPSREGCLSLQARAEPHRGPSLLHHGESTGPAVEGHSVRYSTTVQQPLCVGDTRASWELSVKGGLLDTCGGLSGRAGALHECLPVWPCDPAWGVQGLGGNCRE